MPRDVRSIVDLHLEVTNIDPGLAPADDTLIAFFYAREKGSTARAVTVHAHTLESGALELKIYDSSRKLIYTYSTAKQEARHE